MTGIGLIASLATAAAIGAAGYAAVSGVPVDARAQVSPATKDAVSDAAAAVSSSPPAVAEFRSDVRSPRECRPLEGVDRECEYL